jgi:hypothetical protein
MPTDRRNFLQRLSAGAVAATVLPSALPTSLAAESAPRTTRSELSALAEAGVPREEWDLSWTRRLTGKHKAVFDAPEVESGAGVLRSGLWLRQYAEVLKAAPSDLTSVIVLRHNAIILTMTPAFWDEYELGEKKKVTSPLDDKPTKKNPALLSEADGAPASYAALALDRQIANGVIVLACGLAFREMVGMVSTKHKLKGEEAQARANAGLIPGVIMQPSGFFATTLAQENGCIYVRGS